MDEGLIVLTGLLAVLAASAASVAVLAWALPKLRNEVQGYPLEVQIEAALLPLAFEGICAAYRVSEMAVDEIGERLRGADKARVANILYDLLPDSVAGFPLSVVKALVSRERFCEIVEAAFAQFDRRFTEHQARYEQLFEEWKHQVERGPQLIIEAGKPRTLWAEPPCTWTLTITGCSNQAGDQAGDLHAEPAPDVPNLAA